RVLLLPGSAPERREVRERLERAGTARRTGRRRHVRGQRRRDGVRPPTHSAGDRTPRDEGPRRGTRRVADRRLVTGRRRHGRWVDPLSSFGRERPRGVAHPLHGTITAGARGTRRSDPRWRARCTRVARPRSRGVPDRTTASAIPHRLTTP